MSKPTESPAPQRRNTRVRSSTEDPDLVTCHFSGKRVPRTMAVLVRLGPGQKVWMLREFCRDG